MRHGMRNQSTTNLKRGVTEIRNNESPNVCEYITYFSVNKTKRMKDKKYQARMAESTKQSCWTDPKTTNFATP